MERKEEYAKAVQDGIDEMTRILGDYAGLEGEYTLDDVWKTLEEKGVTDLPDEIAEKLEAERHKALSGVIADLSNEKEKLAEVLRKYKVLRSYLSIEILLESLDVAYEERQGRDGSIAILVPLLGLYPNKAMMMFDDKGNITSVVINDSVTLLCTSVLNCERKAEPLSGFGGHGALFSLIRKGVCIGSLILADREYESFVKENDYLL